MKILAIDPGTRMLGWAYFDDGKLKDCGIARTKSKDLVVGALEMATQIDGFPDVITCEIMQVYMKSKVDPKHLINISIVSGVIMSSILAKKDKYYLPLPREWKGNLDKNTHCSIITGLCPAVKKFIKEKKIAMTNEEHVVDAVGLGLWTIEQLKKEKKK